MKIRRILSSYVCKRSRGGKHELHCCGACVGERGSGERMVQSMRSPLFGCLTEVPFSTD